MSFKLNLIIFSLCFSTIVIFPSAQPAFMPFDFCLTEHDKQILQSLHVDDTQQPYNNFGRLENLEHELQDFLKSIGNDQGHAQAGAKIINNIVALSIQKLQAQTAWITIRSFQALHQNTYTPRWHTDGFYYAPFKGKQYKIACALKGPGTLFCTVSEDIREKFQALESQTFANLTKEETEKLTFQQRQQIEQKTRIKLAELLADLCIDQAPTAHGMLFIVADKNSAAIHSEPPIHEDRLFISIVPGTHEQIQELYNQWHPSK